MPDIKARSLTYNAAEEHILRRLGGAVVTQWAELPAAVRERLVAQATYMLDRYQAVQLREQLEAFIRERQSDAGGDSA